MNDLTNWIRFAGIIHIVLCIASLWIPRVMNWKDTLSLLPNLFRQMFWNYSLYTWGTNLFFGIVSLAFPLDLINQSPLAISLSAFITVYWIGRLFVQIFYFDRSMMKEGWLHRLAEAGLMGMFVGFSGVYGWAFWNNIK